MDPQLSQREASVLAEVISTYLHTAAPVGSQLVARALGRAQRQISPATVRSVMAELEAAGFLTHPHRSAGRLPTLQGLRYFVDCLIETEPLSEASEASIQAQYAATKPELSAILLETSTILSRLSQYAGLVVMPVHQDLVFRHLEFVRLSSRRLLGIFVTREGETHNRVMEIDASISYSELERINNYCNTVFVGLTLAEARVKAARAVSAAQVEFDQWRTRAMQYATEVMAGHVEQDVVVNGEAQLLDYPEFSEMSKARLLLAALTEKRQLLALFERAEQGHEVRVFIGAESRYDGLQDCSIVVSPYRHQGKVLGTLGVIGPTRMAYGRVIPIVQCAAEQVSQWLAGA